MPRVPTQDLARTVLRTLVPLSLAGGFIGLYQDVAPRIVPRLGPGFEPRYVAAYVLGLVILFLLDSFARDRRLSRSRAAAAAAEEHARELRVSAGEMRFLLDVSEDLHESDRLDTALLRVLERLNAVLPFTVGSVHLRDGRAEAARSPTLRAIFPLTASLGTDVAAAARAAIDPIEAQDGPRHDAGTSRVICPLIPPGRKRAAIGALVLEGVAALRESDAERLRAIADRVAAAVFGLDLLGELEQKERSLRLAWQELRRSSRNLAKSSADSEAATVGRAASLALNEPVYEALTELRRLERAAPATSSAGAAVRPGLARLKRRLLVVRDGLAELRRIAPAPRAAEPIHVNDAVVAALDLVAPDFRRAGIDVRVTLANDLAAVRVDEGALVRLLTRLFRRCRGHLRSGPPPKRLTVTTEPFGASIRVRITDNGAGLSPPHREKPATRDPRMTSPLKRALRKAERSLFREELEAHGIALKAHAEVGRGHRYSVRIRVPVAEAGGPAGPVPADAAGMIRDPS